MDISGCEISHNSCIGFGGGIGANITHYLKHGETSGLIDGNICRITMKNTKIMDNIAGSGAGVLINVGDAVSTYSENEMTLEMNNCSITNNYAKGDGTEWYDYGGSGLFITSNDNNKTEMIMNDTIVSNNKCVVGDVVFFGSGSCGKLVIGGSVNIVNNTRGHFNDGRWIADIVSNLTVGKNISVNEKMPLSEKTKIIIDVPLNEEGVPYKYKLLSCTGGATTDNFVCSNPEFRTVTKVDGIYIELNLNLVLINDGSKTAEYITAEVPILKGNFTYTYTWILNGEVVKTETTTSNTSSLDVARDLIENKTCICKVSTTLGDRSYDAENQIEIPAVVPEEDDDSDEPVNQNIMFIGSITAVVIALFALAFVISKRK